VKEGLIVHQDSPKYDEEVRLVEREMMVDPCQTLVSLFLFSNGSFLFISRSPLFQFRERIFPF
jgi:hypothetical protein